MTQQPFSRPGAIDLSGLGQPAPRRRARRAPGRAARAGGGSSYSVVVDEQNFQGLLEQSMTAPVLLVFYSRTRMPESGQLADDLATVVGEHEGRYLLGLVDIDAAPQIAQAMQIPSIPLVVAVVDGRPMPLIQDPLPIEELRTALTQVGQQLTTQGITGRHQPRSAPPRRPRARRRSSTRATPPPRTRSRPVTSTAPWRSTRSWSTPTRPTSRPPAASRWPRSCSAPRASTSTQARAAAADDPDDVDAQTLVADLDMLGGHVDDAFTRLVNLVARTSRQGPRQGARPPARPLRRGRQRRPARAGGAPQPGVRALLIGAVSACRAPSGRPRAGRPARGTASTRRSRARPRRRSGPTAGRRRARRTRRP